MIIVKTASHMSDTITLTTSGFCPLYAISFFYYMPTCGFCKNECNESDQTKFGYEHPECNREFCNRRDGGICVKCREPTLKHHAWCENCDVNSEFLGYPGGSA